MSRATFGIPTTAFEICRATRVKWCHICEKADCGDNTNPTIVELKRQRDAEIRKVGHWCAEYDKLRRAVSALLTYNGGTTKSEEAKVFNQPDDYVMVRREDFGELLKLTAYVVDELPLAAPLSLPKP